MIGYVWLAATIWLGMTASDALAVGFAVGFWLVIGIVEIVVEEATRTMQNIVAYTWVLEADRWPK